MGRIKTVKQADNSITLEKLQQEGFDSIYVEKSKEPNYERFWWSLIPYAAYLAQQIRFFSFMVCILGLNNGMNILKVPSESCAQGH